MAIEGLVHPTTMTIADSADAELGKDDYNAAHKQRLADNTLVNPPLFSVDASNNPTEIEGFPYVSHARRLDIRKADGVVLYTCAMTSGSPNVVCSDGAFTSADVGKLFSAYSMNTSSLTLTAKIRGTILSVQSATEITLSVNASATVSSGNGRFVYGTDALGDTENLFTVCSAKGGFVELPVGVLVYSGNIVVPGGVTLIGRGRDYPSTREVLNRGTVLVRAASFDASGSFVTLGETQSDYSSGEISPQIRDLGIDAIESASRCLSTYASRAEIENCTIWRGFDYALDTSNGQDCKVYMNVIGQMNIGTVVNAVGDGVYIKNVIRGSGNGGHQVRISNMSDVYISQNHMFKGGVGTSSYATLLGNNVFLQWTGFNSGKYSNVAIDNNIFDGTAGAHVKATVGTTAACHPKGLSISGNQFFQNEIPDNTYPVIDIAVSSGATLGQLKISGNVGIATLADADTNEYSAFLSATGAGTYGASSVTDNHVSHCLAGISGGVLTPSVGANTNTRTLADDSIVVF